MAPVPITKPRIRPLWLGTGISAFLLLVLIATTTALGRWEAMLVGGEVDPFARVPTGVLRDSPRILESFASS